MSKPNFGPPSDELLLSELVDPEITAPDALRDAFTHMSSVMGRDAADAVRRFVVEVINRTEVQSNDA